MPASVEFHTGVSDPLYFACRLLRKASRGGARALVCVPPADLAALDELLWTFEPHEFVPHVRLTGPGGRLAGRTPIWLATESDPPVAAGPLAGLEPPRLLVNLGCEVPEDPDAYDRIIEILGTDAAQVRAGRVRWGAYQGWGVKPLHHGAA